MPPYFAVLLLQDFGCQILGFRYWDSQSFILCLQENVCQKSSSIRHVVSQLLHVLQIEHRYGSQGLHATSVMPGGIMTELGRHMDPSLVDKFMTPELKKSMKSPEQGAATTVWAAIGREWEGKGGKYLNDCAIAGTPQEGEVNLGYAPYAYDAEASKRLWEVSMQLVGLQ